MSVKILFPVEPNAVDGFGLPIYLSECKKFRLLEITNPCGTGHLYYAHRKQGKGNWLGVPGLPFATKFAARQACEKTKLKKLTNPKQGGAPF